MAIYKNWTKITELDCNKNFLKLRLMVEDDEKKLAEFQKLYPELFCDEPVNLRISRSSIIEIEKEKQEYLNKKEPISEYETTEKKKWIEQDNLDNAEYWSKRNWVHSLYIFGVPTVNISFGYSDFWLESESRGLTEIIKLIKDSENYIESDIFAGAHKINLFNKEMILVDYNYNIAPEDTIILALADHIDLNS